MTRDLRATVLSIRVTDTLGRAQGERAANDSR